jgi:heme/copper-type cytochrome/quinol oxidase subunit 2
LKSTEKNTSIIAVSIAAAVILSAVLGFYFATITTAQAPAKTTQSSAKTVNLDIIPDWGGATYDAFVLAGTVGQSPPSPGTNTTSPGLNNNNITVPANTPINFVITSIDTAVLENFNETVSTPFMVYNDTNSGQVAVQYAQGETISNLPIGHTFTIGQLGVNIPIPPTTMVTFTLTFSKPGVYLYLCETPCGLGMNVTGYMQGYVTVQ